MKSFYTIMFISILILTSCQNNSSSTENKTPPTISPAPSPNTTPKASPIATPTPTPAPRLISSVSTKLLDKNENRLNNIALAIESVSGYIINPGEIFSFNQIVGERTTKKGYRVAPVIIKGEKELDHGGGVCQISTTIYQAAKKAGLTIKERHDHQKNIGYAKKGNDAAVDYGNLDFRFLNNTDTPIQIKVTVTKKEIIAELYRLS